MKVGCGGKVEFVINVNGWLMIADTHFNALTLTLMLTLTNININVNGGG